MTGDRLRKRVRRIVERDIAGGADTTSLLHADILALLDADLEDLDAKSSERPSDVSDGLPDTPTADDPECCASGRCEVCSPGFDWARNGALPDAPADDGLRKAIDAALRGDEITFLVDGIPLAAHTTARRQIIAALVVARPWQAEVEAARQDALNQAADDFEARPYEQHTPEIKPASHGEWWVFECKTCGHWESGSEAHLRELKAAHESMGSPLRPQVWLRDRAARGETRQP